MNKRMKKALSLVLSVVLVLAMAVPAFAAFGTTVVASVKGVAATLGTPGATPDAAVPGAVSIPTATAAGAVATTMTITDDDSDVDAVVIKLIASGTTVDADGFTGGTALTNEAVANGDNVVFQVTDGANPPQYYVVAVTVEDPADPPEEGGLPTSETENPGTPEYIDMDAIVDIVLPIDGDLAFTPDPQGLAAIKPGESGNMDELEGGLILPTKTAEVINYSGFDVNLEVVLKPAGDATNIAYAASEEATKTAVKTGTGNNMLLLAVPSSVNMKTRAAAEIPASGEDAAVPAVPSQYKMSENGYVIETDGITLNFLLPNAQYDASRDAAGNIVGAVMKPGTGNGTGFQIYGFVNPNANWADYVDPDKTGPLKPEKDMGVEAIYTPVKAASTDAAGVAAVPGLISETGLDKMKVETLTPVVPDPTNDVKFDAAGTKAFSISETDYLADGLVVYLSQKPASITSITNPVTNYVVDSATGYTYDATTGVLNFTLPFAARNEVMPLSILAGGVTYRVDLTVTK